MVDIKLIKEVLEAHRGKRHLIILPKLPDPDAIAAAFAHRLISSTFDIEVTILYSGSLRPRQNVAMIRLLNIDILAYHEDFDLSRYDAFLLVRSGEAVDPEIRAALEKDKLRLLFTLDQKEGFYADGGEAPEKPAGSSVSTLYAALIKGGLIELDKARKEHVAVATALLFGILSFTEQFVTANQADLVAASFLSHFRDAELLEHILSQVRSRYVMEIIQRALAKRITAENYSIAGVGYLRAEDREAVSQAAEFLLTEENVHTAIVYGIIQSESAGETLVGSVCTTKLTLYPLEFIEEIFGRYIRECEDESSQITDDSFTIPIGFLSGSLTEQFKELKWQVYDTKVKHILFEKIGINPQPTSETA